MQQTPPPYRGDVTEPPTGERRSSRRTSPAERWLILAIALASGAVAAVVSDARPAMWTPADVAWRALVVVGVALTVGFFSVRRWPEVLGPSAAASAGE